MTYLVGDYVATHPEPVWRDRANFVFRVPIESDQGQRRWEQLWWAKRTEDRFTLCCIPFFAYDLSLGDEVQVDAERRIISVLAPSGQWTYRVWFGDDAIRERSLALKAIESHRPVLEWSSPNLLALSVSTESTQALADTLRRLELEGILQYETGRTSKN